MTGIGAVLRMPASRRTLSLMYPLTCRERSGFPAGSSLIDDCGRHGCGKRPAMRRSRHARDEYAGRKDKSPLTSGDWRTPQLFACRYWRAPFEPAGNNETLRYTPVPVYSTPESSPQRRNALTPGTTCQSIPRRVVASPCPTHARAVQRDIARF